MTVFVGHDSAGTRRTLEVGGKTYAYYSIAAAEAGKDVVCEKPMTRFVAEGRAVVDAFKRYKRIFQIGTYGRFGQAKDPGKVATHKLMRSGLLNPNPGVFIKKGGLKVKEWSGQVNLPPKEPHAVRAVEPSSLLVTILRRSGEGLEGERRGGS